MLRRLLRPPDQVLSPTTADATSTTTPTPSSPTTKTPRSRPRSHLRPDRRSPDHRRSFDTTSTLVVTWHLPRHQPRQP